MLIGRGENVYEWTEKWAKIPDTHSARTGWAHHDIVVSETGKVIAFHQSDPTVLIFDEVGNLERAWNSTVNNAHGMHLVKESNTEYLWLADNTTGKVVKTTLDGHLVMALEKPDIAAYRDGKYSPTSVTVFEENDGGNGDIYVADGYGSNYVHWYKKNGEYINSINGEEGEAGAFSTPHGIWIDTRKPERELYIADRSNGRIQVYDLVGNYKRVLGRSPGSDWLHSPSSFAQTGNYLITAELRGSRITIMDKDDNPVAYLGENSGAFLFSEDWPNVPHETLEVGKFNSPHGLATDSSGNIYVAEWLVGGRINKLSKL
jgi:DNA-binding beta-propeller fold protein YncE